MSSTSPWVYKAGAIAATVTLAAGAGYVLYRYALTNEPEEEEAEPSLPMQALLTGGAAGGSGAKPAGSPALPVRKTPTPPGRAGSPKPARGAKPTLPPRKAPAKPAAPGAASTSAAAADGAAAAPDAASTSADTADAAAAAAAAPGAAAKPASPGLKACACCGEPLAVGLPQRCGQCKAVYYCSTACQKKHWPDHKGVCAKGGAKSPAAATGGDAAAAAPAGAGADGAAAEAKSNGGASTDSAAAAAASSSSSAPAAAAAEGGAARGSSGGGGDAGAGGSGSAAAAPGGLQSALVEVLRQAAEKGAGTLDGAFEEAVMHFLGGKLDAALSAFTSLQAAARQAGRADLVLELHKWLGHTHTKMGSFGPAADAFRAGVEDAKAAGNAAARVDNAIGLGSLWKLAGQMGQAAEVLKEALVVAQEAGSAGMQSEVLVALGNVAMATEPEEGLACLQIAVKLREDEVARAAESGDKAGIATGMMQAAAAMVNMAAALFATRRFDQAKEAYEQAAEIFELMEDRDKVVQVLINLANLAELQLDAPAQALAYRLKLAAALREAGHPGIAGGAAAPPCGICAKPIPLTAARASGDDGAAMVLLGCLHVQHDACFKEWCDASAAKAADVAAAAAAAAGGEAAAAMAAAAASPGAKRTTCCPTCKAPVPVMN